MPDYTVNLTATVTVTPGYLQRDLGMILFGVVDIFGLGTGVRIWRDVTKELTATPTVIGAMVKSRLLTLLVTVAVTVGWVRDVGKTLLKSTSVSAMSLKKDVAKILVTTRTVTPVVARTFYRTLTGAVAVTGTLSTLFKLAYQLVRKNGITVGKKNRGITR